MSSCILVTGGAGYIGSHTVVQLLQAGYAVVVLDNLSNSSPVVLERVEHLTGKSVDFFKADIRDEKALQNIFSAYSFDAVIHFAGLKAVGESEAQPLKYYSNNVAGSVALFEAMARFGVKTLVFSSSATVYGDPGYPQYREDTPKQPVNVYGRTKLAVEQILQDLTQADPGWRVALLRYFNPVGAHPSGLIGEDPLGPPNNLMPFIAQVAVGQRPSLSVFGGNYPTPDGTGLRDYIHVEDLAAGHLAALTYLVHARGAALTAVNLGTGRPHSVLEMIQAFEQASGRPIPFQIVGRRAGDLAEYFADPSLAHQLLGWRAQLGIDRMCQDTWRWQQQNPGGYAASGL